MRVSKEQARQETSVSQVRLTVLTSRQAAAVYFFPTALLAPQRGSDSRSQPPAWENPSDDPRKPDAPPTLGENDAAGPGVRASIWNPEAGVLAEGLDTSAPSMRRTRSEERCGSGASSAARRDDARFFAVRWGLDL